MTRRKDSSESGPTPPPEAGRTPLALRQFELLVDRSADFISFTDREGRILYTNAAASRLLGLAREELRASAIADYFAPEEKAQVRAEVFAAALDQGEWIGERTLQNAQTGAAIPVFCRVFRVDDPATAEPASFAIFAQDLSEQKRRERELHDAQQRGASLLAAGEVGTWTFDVESARVIADANLCRIFGLSFEEAREAHLDEYLRAIHPEDLPAVQAAIAAAIRSGSAYLSEYRILRKDGSIRHVIARGLVERDENGRAVRLPGVVLDITARKQVEEALRASEANFRQLADTIPQLAWMADAGGAIFWYNRRWYEYTGSKPADMEGWGWQSVHDPKELPNVLEHWQASIRSGEPFDMTFPLKSASGEFRRFLTRVMPFRDDNGRTLLWFGTNTDVEEQRRISETMREQREQLALALEAGQLGTWQLDLETMELTASEGGRENCGLAADAPFTYATLWEMMHPDDRAPTGAAVQRAIDENRSYSAEYRVVWPDASVHWISARGRPVEGDDKPRLLVGITQEITDIKFAEEQREQHLEFERAARAEAERVGRMKDEFLATLSHELRTPLNAIFGWTQLMKGGGIEPKLLAEGIDVIDRNVRAQTRLIEDLLDMSRVISGKLRLDVQYLDPSQSIDAAVETVRPAAEAKGIRIEKILDPQSGPISGDPGRIQQIFWNLLSNAIKFTPRGGKVQVLLERVDSHLEITVADTGQGISREFLPYVFDRFRQADAAANRRHGGLGLGLAIAKQLVELHGGSIRVESKGPGKGTAFIVSLPLQVLQAQVPRPDRRHPRATTQTPLFEKCTDLAGLKVLVVDDERDARELLRIMLENCEAEVVTASSAAEALPLVKSHAPDVLVSDIGMAEVDGYEFLRQVRAAEPRGRKMPAIALTAFARSEDRTKALLTGFSAHISKPVEPAELIATIVSVVERTIKT